MLSLANVGVAQGVQYYKKENYYTDEEALNYSRWSGKGAEILGLIGLIGKEDFEQLLNGKDKDGNVLVHHKEYNEQISTYDINKVKDNIGKYLQESGLNESSLSRVNGFLLSAFEKGEKISRGEAGLLKKNIIKVLSATTGKNEVFERIKKSISNEINTLTVKAESRAAVDLTFCAPKSVSIQALVFDDIAMRDMHNQAVKTAMKYVEEKFSLCRVQKDKVRRFEKTGNLVVAEFDHTTSRMYDPHLHTHCVVMNMVKNGDSWRALSNEEIHNHSKLIGLIYQNELANQIQKKGYKITVHSNGTFDLAHYTRPQIEELSKRSAQLKELGATTQKEATKLVKVDRPSKIFEINSEVLKRHHLKEAAAIGMTAAVADNNKIINQNNIKINPDFEQDRNEKIKIELSSAIVQCGENDVKFSEGQVYKAMLENNLGKFEHKDILPLLDPLLKEQISVLGGKKYVSEQSLMLEEQARNIVIQGIRKYERFSNRNEIISKLEESLKIDSSMIEQVKLNMDSLLNTSALLDKEKSQILSKLDVIKNNKISGIEASLLKKDIWGVLKHSDLKRQDKIDTYKNVIKNMGVLFGLTEGQRQAVIKTLESKDKVIIWQGSAGVGKTTSLRLIAEEMSKTNVVMGFSPQKKAANGLAESIQIKADTVSLLLTDKYEIKKEEGKGLVWIVDESSMLSAKQAFDLMKKADEYDARLILAGDMKQLGSVNAGNPFYDFQQHVTTLCILDESVRQLNPVLNDAVIFANRQRHLEALEYLKEDYIVEVPDFQEMASKVAQEYLSKPDTEREQTLVTALTNENLTRINDKIRDGLKAEGKLTNPIFVESYLHRQMPTQKSMYASAYDVGDYVVIQRSSKQAFKEGVKCKQYYKIVEKNFETNQLKILDEKTNQHFYINPKQEKMQSYSYRDLEICVGDKLIWSQNDQENQRINKDQFVVQKIDHDNKNMLVKYESGKEEQVDLSKPLKVTHAFSVTYYAAQGVTVKNALVLDEKSATKNNMYVYMTRATSDLKIFTESYEDMKKRASSRSSGKNTATELYENEQKLKESKDGLSVGETKENTLHKNNLRDGKDKYYRTFSRFENSQQLAIAFKNELQSLSSRIVDFSKTNDPKIISKKDFVEGKVFSQNSISSNTNQKSGVLRFVVPTDVSTLYAYSQGGFREKLEQAHRAAVAKSIDFLIKNSGDNRKTSTLYSVERGFVFDRQGKNAIPYLNSSVYILENSQLSYKSFQQEDNLRKIYESELCLNLKELSVPVIQTDQGLRVQSVNRELSLKFTKEFNHQIKESGLESYAPLFQIEEKLKDYPILTMDEISLSLHEFKSNADAFKESSLSEIEELKKQSFLYSIDETVNLVIAKIEDSRNIFDENQIFESVLDISKNQFRLSDNLKILLKVQESQNIKLIGFSSDGRAFYCHASQYAKESQLYETVKKGLDETFHQLSLNTVKNKINEFSKENEKELPSYLKTKIESILCLPGNISIANLKQKEQDLYVSYVQSIYKSEKYFVEQLSFEEKEISKENKITSVFKYFREHEIHGNPLLEKQVLIVKGANYLGTDEMKRLFLESQSAKVKIILVGDAKTQGFTSGKPFQILDGMFGLGFHYLPKNTIEPWHILEQKNSNSISSSLLVQKGFETEEQLNTSYARLTGIMNEASKYFESRLYNKTSATQAAFQYLSSERKLSKPEMQSFSLGVCDSSPYFIKFMESKGFTKEELFSCALITKSQKGKIYTPFFNRITFPIRDLHGNVIAFGGRIFEANTEKGYIPKYINSKETQIFRKSNDLFNIENAIAAIKKNNHVIICEGYMDAIALRRAGVENVVAVLGTALTQEHIAILKQHTSNIVLMFDNDRAGKEATTRSFLNLYRHDLNISVTGLNKCKDADEYLSKYGRDSLKDQINKNKKDIINYIAQDFKEQYKNDFSKMFEVFSSKFKSFMTLHPDKIKMELDVLKLSFMLGFEYSLLQGDKQTLTSALSKFDYTIDTKLIESKLVEQKYKPIFDILTEKRLEAKVEDKHFIRMNRLEGLFYSRQMKNVETILNASLGNENTQKCLAQIKDIISIEKNIPLNSIQNKDVLEFYKKELIGKEVDAIKITDAIKNQVLDRPKNLDNDKFLLSLASLKEDILKNEMFITKEYEIFSEKIYHEQEILKHVHNEVSNEVLKSLESQGRVSGEILNNKLEKLSASGEYLELARNKFEQINRKIIDEHFTTNKDKIFDHYQAAFNIHKINEEDVHKFSQYFSKDEFKEILFQKTMESSLKDGVQFPQSFTKADGFLADTAFKVLLPENKDEFIQNIQSSLKIYSESIERSEKELLNYKDKNHYKENFIAELKEFRDKYDHFKFQVDKKSLYVPQEARPGFSNMVAEKSQEAFKRHHGFEGDTVMATLHVARLPEEKRAAVLDESLTSYLKELKDKNAPVQQPGIEQEKEKSLVKNEFQPSEKIEYEDDLSLGIEKDFPLSDSLKETAERLGVKWSPLSRQKN